jgi:hypothetical protein
MHCRCCQVNNHDCCQVLLLVILSDHLLSPHQEELSSRGRKYRGKIHRTGSTGLGNIMLHGYQVRIQRRDNQDRKYRARQYNATWVSGENTDEGYTG